MAVTNNKPTSVKAGVVAVESQKISITLLNKDVKNVMKELAPDVRPAKIP